MNKLMYRFVATRKKKKKKKKRNRPVFRHGMPPKGIPRKKKKEIDPFLDTVCPFRASRVITTALNCGAILFIKCSGLKCAVFKRKFHHFETANRKNNF